MRRCGYFAILLLCALFLLQPVRADYSCVASTQNVTVDGAVVTAEVYNIDGSNYFKLRDLAWFLNGTGSQFAVGYDAETRTITVTKGASYTPNGTELQMGVDQSATCVPSTQRLLIDGEPVDLTAYNIGGSNFFKLRDAGEALGFQVGYDAATRTATISSSSTGTYYALYREIVQQREQTWGQACVSYRQAPYNRMQMLTGVGIVRLRDLNGDGIDELILGYGRQQENDATMDDFQVEVCTFNGQEVRSYTCNAFWGENGGGMRYVRFQYIDDQWMLADGHGNDIGYVGSFIGIQNGDFVALHSADTGAGDAFTIDGVEVPLSVYENYVGDYITDALWYKNPLQYDFHSMVRDRLQETLEETLAAREQLSLARYTPTIPTASAYPSNAAISYVSATSHLTEPGLDHGPGNVIDGTLENAWVEGAAGAGIGESVTLHFDDEYLLQGFTIYNGYQKRQDLFMKNARVKLLTVSFSDGSSESFTLADSFGPQSISFAEARSTSNITFRIDAVYPGKVYEDTVISEIELF